MNVLRITVCGIVLFSALISVSACGADDRPAVDYVNPLIGTPAGGFTPKLGTGGTMPCVGAPFAMTNFVAQTRENKISRMPYAYEDSSIIGFMATHQPTVWMGDYGYVSMMPQIGPLRVLPEERACSFDHADEISRPYYYSVRLKTGKDQTIRSEIAAAGRAGMLRFTFPAAAQARLILHGINLNPALQNRANDYASRIRSLRGYMHIDPQQREVTGYNPDRQSAKLGPDLPDFKGYFIIQFDKAFTAYGTWSGSEVFPDTIEQFGTRMGAYLQFSTTQDEVVQVRVGTSFISLDQARENLRREVPDWDFQRLADATQQQWQDNLNRIQLTGATEDQKAIFYTALFHCMLFPREMSEYGRYYSAADDKVHNGVSYTDYSLWDTFRALHPLLIFIQPERVNPMIQSMIQFYEQNGWLPMWPNPAESNIMIASHADAVIADAYVKGFRGYDVKKAYEAMRKDAMTPPDCDTQRKWGDREAWQAAEARGGLSYYHSLGYVPSDKVSQSVSRTIEFAIDDYCVAQVARALGRDEDAARMMEWSGNYRNVYNAETGFMAPRRWDGSWDPRPNSGFCEGSNWTYTFGAAHDVEGMIRMMGGPQAFIAKLDENFSGGHYRHDNEPGHHYAYLYDYCGQPWKTQELVRQQITENYRNEPLGINGNDDCGQMSAWYIFGVMGFYPVVPASGVYAIGAPQLPQITLNYTVDDQPRRLTIVARDLSEKNKYVQSVSLDGKALTVPFISHAELIGAASLVFTMGPLPNREWGTTAQ